MDLTRREAVKVVGLAAAAASLSCPSSERSPSGEPTKEGDDMAEQQPPQTHRVIVRECGHYVVVEVDSTYPYSGRGKLEVRPGDTVVFASEAVAPIVLVLPRVKVRTEAGGFDFLSMGAPGEKGEGEGNPADLRMVPLTTGGSARVVVPDAAAFGHYEYTVLFETNAPSGARSKPVFVSEFAHAIGGSSSEFIIRRDIGP
jgi:hypothetical protein